MKKVFLFLTGFMLVFALGLGLCHAADVTLQWDANTESDLAGYRVYYGTASRAYDQAKGSGLDAGLNTTFTVPGLVKGPTYYFAITAYDNEVPSLESDYSDEVSTNFAPGAPKVLRIKSVVEVTVEVTQPQ